MTEQERPEWVRRMHWRTIEPDPRYPDSPSLFSISKGWETRAEAAEYLISKFKLKKAAKSHFRDGGGSASVYLDGHRSNPRRCIQLLPCYCRDGSHPVIPTWD